MTALPIRPLETLEEFQACVRLQEEVWGRGFSERVPVAILKVSQRLGGVVSGAFDGEGLAGFVFGMTGLEDGRNVHWSDMLAVRPGLRDAGLGMRLKAHQRELLLARGITTCYWTFDPLESKNAWLNMAKLGAVAREYLPDMYGSTDSHLHAGIGTDRFLAVWELDTPRVEARLAGRERPPTLEELEGVSRPVEVEVEDGLPRPVLPTALVGVPTDRMLVPLPARIHDLKERDPELAARWREVTRSVLSTTLDAGMEVRELVRGDEHVSWYLVETRRTPPAGSASPKPQKGATE